MLKSYYIGHLNLISSAIDYCLNGLLASDYSVAQRPQATDKGSVNLWMFCQLFKSLCKPWITQSWADCTATPLTSLCLSGVPLFIHGSIFDSCCARHLPRPACRRLSGGKCNNLSANAAQYAFPDTD
ncbi:hypothetical protein CEXT_56601 [Caerostris extrusa]|uniref:Uncharacterized protein n=1 Tax=Caerostris extrusa TaxID=172846 RepID=A0AAV4T297_CAEEX|nr:hypothetical protein CEXT_56601 [Caerostris extrusa]